MIRPSGRHHFPVIAVLVTAICSSAVRRLIAVLVTAMTGGEPTGRKTADKGPGRRTEICFDDHVVCIIGSTGIANGLHITDNSYKRPLDAATSQPCETPAAADFTGERIDRCRPPTHPLCQNCINGYSFLSTIRR